MNDQLVLKEELEKVIATFEFILDCLSMESKVIIEKRIYRELVKIGGLIIILEVHTIVLKQGPWKKLCSILVVYKNHKV